MTLFFVPFKFKNRDIGHTLVNTLVLMERTHPKAFWSVIDIISDEFQALSETVGNGTTLGMPRSHGPAPNTTDIDQFMAMRFRDRKLGQKIVITLIEIESRDPILFSKLSQLIRRPTDTT